MEPLKRSWTWVVPGPLFENCWYGRWNTTVHKITQYLFCNGTLKKIIYEINFILLFCTLDEWIKFDDDKVSIVTPEDILRLSGGGDWHIAYVLLYGPRRIEIMEEESEQ